MPNTTGYSFGDIVLVSFPFTDQSATKRRPAVVISSLAYHRERPDLIIMAVTSQVRPHASFGDVRIDDWKGAGLVKPSIIKPVIATIEHTLIIRHLGRLDRKAQEALRKTIHDVLG